MTRTPAPAGRPLSPGLEEILDRPHPVLDHGFIRVVDYMGNDDAVVDAARVSYGRGTRRRRENGALLHYLMRHRHTTPFEMCELKLHVKLPVFVARQWIRHRTASVNEISARYSVLDREFYVPSAEALGVQDTANRQGRAGAPGADEVRQVLELLRAEGERAHDTYLWLLNGDEGGRTPDPARRGIARELARMGLSMNFYTQWYWKTDLHNLLRFIALRSDSRAQYEIRVYAQVLDGIVRRWTPQVHEAFRTHVLEAVTLSAREVRLLQRMLAGERFAGAEQAGLSVRDWQAFRALFPVGDGAGGDAASAAREVPRAPGPVGTGAGGDVAAAGNEREAAPKEKAPRR